MPNSKFPPSTLDVDVAKKILVEAGRQFCYLVKEENKALSLSPYSHSNQVHINLQNKKIFINLFYRQTYCMEKSS